MKRFLFVAVLTWLSNFSFSQTDTSVINDTRRFQSELKTEYDNPYHTPLDARARKTFKGIKFFPFNAGYVVDAKFVRTPKEKPFQMNTSSGMRKTYVKYAEVLFTIDKKAYKLNVYQSQ